MNLLEKAIKSKFNILLILRYIKRIFEKGIVKLVHYSGFHIEKLPNAKAYCTELTKDGESLKETKLRKTANYLHRTNDLKLYEQILRQLVPNMNINFSQTKFVGSGSGATTLNVYRKVTFNNDAFFEKVYFNNYSDIERVKWFSDKIYSSLNSNIKAPSLHKVFGGELITLFYFNFVDLIPLPTRDINSTIFNFSKELYKLSLTEEIKCKIEKAPLFLKEYKGHFEYIRKIEEAKKGIFEFRGDRFPLKDIEKSIYNSPIIITHGDIHPGNVFKNNYLIDWDPFGLYPLGLEVAYIFYFLYKGELCYKDLYQILETEYRSTILEKDWDDFELNFLYFYYVFTIQNLDGEQLSKIQCNILERIEEVYWEKMNKKK